jgi:uncharacterized protein (TIGR02588 family)
MSQDEQHTNGMQDSGPPPLSEWLVAALGLVLLCASLGYLGWHALRGGSDVPAPSVKVMGIDAQPGRYVVRLRVTNQSPATAAALRVEGVLRQGGEEVERSDTEFQYLPGRSSVQGGLFFQRDPRQFQLEVLAKGFEEP